MALHSAPLLRPTPVAERHRERDDQPDPHISAPTYARAAYTARTKALSTARCPNSTNSQQDEFSTNSRRSGRLSTPRSVSFVIDTHPDQLAERGGLCYRGALKPTSSKIHVIDCSSVT